MIVRQIAAVFDEDFQIPGCHRSRVGGDRFHPGPAGIIGFVEINGIIIGVGLIVHGHRVLHIFRKTAPCLPLIQKAHGQGLDLPGLLKVDQNRQVKAFRSQPGSVGPAVSLL